MTLNPAPSGADDRIEALLSAMSREEKLAQLQIGYRPRLEDAAELVRAGIGAVFWPRSAEAANELQRVAREETPHGIPLLVGLDVVHGQRTIFPIPLAQAASFDPAVAASDARVSAREAASGGVTWTFSPMIDVSRDPRWGRVAEGFGEDTLLNAVFGAAKVRGYQGSSLTGPDSILACAKHYVAYGAAEGGRDYNTVDASEYRLRNVHLEPFRAAVEAGAATVMASFNTVAGRPAHANRWLLTHVLKGEWKHEGLVVGDAEGVVNLLAHGVAEDLPDALAQSFTAGLDMEMGGSVVGPDGRTALTPEALSAERVDDAVRRVLRLKAALGLFDGPYVDPSAEITAPSSTARAAAREAAERSAVLLRNDGTLPLADGPRRVLLVGPYAESTDHLGAWVQSFAEPAGSLADALRDERPDLHVTVLPGASFFGDDPALQEQAARAAAGHDVVVVAVGEPSALTGEASSRSDLRLPGDQERLITAVAGTGVPFAVVLVAGRPLVTGDWIDRAPAVLCAWHLGTEAAPAIARLLTGAANPAGRLPMSFPRTAGQIPVHYDHENTGRPATSGGSLQQEEVDIGLQGPANVDDRFTSKYRDLPLGPQFTFGHGLSYTTFAYGPPSVSVTEIGLEELRGGATVEVCVQVTNTGSRAGDEVVQLYLRDPVASVAQPVRRLRGFSRIALEPGQSSLVHLKLGWQDLGFWTGRGDEYVVEPGRFEVHVGGTLETTRAGEFVVSGLSSAGDTAGET
ncbi:glycoside hydrolase family 3 N-terminal domain-containing protein [Streptomyces heilongjiangensis]|uniref:Glycoside hydrolase family 3 N-terminal domain-containing protein n=1 Tax=Streptomyces heilongjiangensis TaxID=945052 RepID=A0ABW1BIK8_9ACTN|nr:glycoside hydrolase family 3 N-terminal domain-containing protein [Streptomyces heilongjiangensis]MDC2951961.1 glycoside hydrolase family 3 N-terminal domain-containing protein [Streptomyces heilongjiangensis]